ncbi:MAG: hypothetical protein AAGJ37_05765 [Pseudomonadota bacterium]
MNTFLYSLVFEWRYFVRQPSFIIMSSLFLVLSFFATSVEQIYIGSSANHSLNLNSPYLITQMLLIFCVFGLFLMVNFVANTALRARLSGMHELIYTKQTPPGYFLGSFFGSCFTVICVFTFVPTGIFLGSLMPWLGPERVGETNIWFYVQPFLIYIIPSLFALCCLVYAVALRFKSMMAVYLAALVVVIVYLTMDNLLANPEFGNIAAIFDPFALNSFTNETRYWTPLERNSQLTGFTKEMLTNRILWLSVGCLALYFCQYKWAIIDTSKKPSNKKHKARCRAPRIRWHSHSSLGENKIQQYLMRVLFETRLLVYSPSFILLLLFCAYLLIYQLVFPVTYFGTANFPVTYEMVRYIRESFGLIMLIIITFYSAEIVWREHNHQFQELIAVTATPNEVLWLAKLTALCLLGAFVYIMGIAITVIHQVMSGFYAIDLQQYVVSLFYFDALPLLYMTVLSFLIQSISPNKYLGMLFFIVFMVISALLSEVGVDHHMYRYAESPHLLYSDMNRYAWSLETQQKYMIYWGALATLFAVVSFGLWRRGNQTSLGHRFSILSHTLGYGGRFIVVCCIGLFLSMGIVIHHNTTITNEFVSLQSLEANSAAYERTYGAYRYAPTPSVIDSELNIAIFPQQRKLQLMAELTLQNTGTTAIEKLLINLPNHSHSISLRSDHGVVDADFMELKTAWFTFDTPLLPTETFTLDIELIRQHFGFKDAGEDEGLVKNGSFINNMDLLPTFGVNESLFLQDSVKRRKYGLEARKTLPSANNTMAANRSALTKDQSTTHITTHISTDTEQVALAPGAMVDYWQANDRNHFVYRTELPVSNFYNIMSANWQVYAKRFNGLDLSVHYHPKHQWNTRNMVQAMETAIGSFSRRFGDYPFSHLRLVEVPRYKEHAKSVTGTMPISEDAGFIADLRKSAHVDTVFYDIAHEVSRQWFVHKLNIADVEGAGVLQDALAQYAALSLVQETFGRVNLRNFVRHELDNYLLDRAVAVDKEYPLAESQQQRYLSMNKGALVMMSVAQKIDIENVDAAINELMLDFSYETNRYASIGDLIAKLKAYADIDDHQYIDELFSSVMLYDLRIEDVEASPLVNNQYRIAMTVFADKFQLNADGVEERQGFDSNIDFVFFAESPDKFNLANEITMERSVRLESGNQRIEFITDTLPKYVAVDPFVNFIDREARDNVKAID